MIFSLKSLDEMSANAQAANMTFGTVKNCQTKNGVRRRTFRPQNNFREFRNIKFAFFVFFCICDFLMNFEIEHDEKVYRLYIELI